MRRVHQSWEIQIKLTEIRTEHPNDLCARRMCFAAVIPSDPSQERPLDVRRDGERTAPESEPVRQGSKSAVRGREVVN